MIPTRSVGTECRESAAPAAESVAAASGERVVLLAQARHALHACDSYEWPSRHWRLVIWWCVKLTVLLAQAQKFRTRPPASYWEVWECECYDGRELEDSLSQNWAVRLDCVSWLARDCWSDCWSQLESRDVSVKQFCDPNLWSIKYISIRDSLSGL